MSRYEKSLYRRRELAHHKYITGFYDGMKFVEEVNEIEVELRNALGEEFKKAINKI